MHGFSHPRSRAFGRVTVCLLAASVVTAVACSSQQDDGSTSGVTQLPSGSPEAPPPYAGAEALSEFWVHVTPEGLTTYNNPPTTDTLSPTDYQHLTRSGADGGNGTVFMSNGTTTQDAGTCSGASRLCGTVSIKNNFTSTLSSVWAVIDSVYPSSTCGGQNSSDAGVPSGLTEAGAPTGSNFGQWNYGSIAPGATASQLWAFSTVGSCGTSFWVRGRLWGNACSAGQCYIASTSTCTALSPTDAKNCGFCGNVCTSNKCTASKCDRVGDGADGPLVISSNTTYTPTTTKLTANVYASTYTLPVTANSTTPFAVGDEIAIVTMVGSTAGTYELQNIVSKTSSSITVGNALTNSYAATATEYTQVVRVNHYSSLTVNAGWTWSMPVWNGTSGGFVFTRVSGAATINGSIDASGTGFGYGAGASGGSVCNLATPATATGVQGSSPTGTGTPSSVANGGGGGGGGVPSVCCQACATSNTPGGGGGGYATVGGDGTLGTSTTRGKGGGTYGTSDLTTAFMGAAGGGGGGNCAVAAGSGGAGGGIVGLFANSLTVVTGGFIMSNGSAGTGIRNNWEGAGGGGAGGSVFLGANTMTLPTSTTNVVATGGAGGIACGSGGVGGVGRIRLECGTLNGSTCSSGSSTTASPSASVGVF